MTARRLGLGERNHFEIPQLDQLTGLSWKIIKLNRLGRTGPSVKCPDILSKSHI